MMYVASWGEDDDLVETRAAVARALGEGLRGVPERAAPGCAARAGQDRLCRPQLPEPCPRAGPAAPGPTPPVREVRERGGRRRRAGDPARRPPMPWTWRWSSAWSSAGGPAGFGGDGAGPHRRLPRPTTSPRATSRAPSRRSARRARRRPVAAREGLRHVPAARALRRDRGRAGRPRAPARAQLADAGRRARRRARGADAGLRHGRHDLPGRELVEFVAQHHPGARRPGRDRHAVGSRRLPRSARLPRPGDVVRWRSSGSAAWPTRSSMRMAPRRPGSRRRACSADAHPAGGG